MNESQKHSKAELEMLKYEYRMIRAAKLKRLKSRPLKERIAFIKADSDREEWTPEEMLVQLQANGLASKVTILEIRDELQGGTIH